MPLIHSALNDKVSTSIHARDTALTRAYKNTQIKQKGTKLTEKNLRALRAFVVRKNYLPVFPD